MRTLGECYAGSVGDTKAPPFRILAYVLVSGARGSTWGALQNLKRIQSVFFLPDQVISGGQVIRQTKAIKKLFLLGSSKFSFVAYRLYFSRFRKVTRCHVVTLTNLGLLNATLMH